MFGVIIVLISWAPGRVFRTYLLLSGQLKSILQFDHILCVRQSLSCSLFLRGATIIPQLFTRCCSKFCCFCCHKLTLRRAVARGHRSRGTGERSPVNTALGDPYIAEGHKRFIVLYFSAEKPSCSQGCRNSMTVR